MKRGQEETFCLDKRSKGRNNVFRKFWTGGENCVQTYVDWDKNRVQKKLDKERNWSETHGQGKKLYADKREK